MAMATAGARAAAKRKRQAPVALDDSDSDDGVCIVQYAPGTAPPPRPRRAFRRLHAASSSSTDAAALTATTPAPAAPPKPDGLVLEVGYMGTTRAVIGHGFQVCELLFADEFSSLQITNWAGGDPQTLCDMIEDYAARIGLLGDNARAVHCVDSPCAGTVTLHLVSKQVARGLFSRLCTSDVMAIEPIHSTGLVKDDALTRAEYSHRLTMTWADGVATGGADVFFADAAEANAFLASYYRKESQLSSCKITVIGVPALDDIDMEELEEDVVLERVLQLSEYDRQSWVPPLRSVRVDESRTNDQMFFDEVKIGRMRAHRIAELEFNVQIVSGLPLDVDEVRLEELVAPHKIVHCKVVRMEDTGRRPSEAAAGRQRRAMPLTWHIDPSEAAVDWVDGAAKRIGVYVHFPNAERMKAVYDAAKASPMWSGMVSPMGQPVRLGIEYIYCAHLHMDVYQYFRHQVIMVRQSLVNKSVWCTLDKDKENKDTITIKFGSTTREGLARVVQQFEDVIECERVDNEVLVSVLFSRAGRAKVRDWLASRADFANSYAPAHIRLCDEERVIWVYGLQASRLEGFSALRSLALKIQQEVQVVDRIARIDPGLLEGSAHIPASIDEGNRAPLMVQPVLRNTYQCAVIDDVNHLVVAGSGDRVRDRLLRWNTSGCFMTSEELLRQDPRPECGVCMMQADEPVVKFTLCGHTFCHECIQPGLSDSNKLPLVCPIGGCGSRIHVKDIAKSTKDVRALVETAVFDYVAKHASECAVCPKSGCNQVLSRAFIEGASDSDEQYAFCDKCAKTYCLTCSEATSNAMERHDGSTCDDFQAVGGLAGDHFVKFIRDKIFTLCCPNCKAAFLDFDGCTSVACGNVTCREYFCANCLDYSSKSSATTHEHVLRCPKNPLPGRYHVPVENLVTAHRTRRTDKLRDYLVANVPVGNARRVVLRRLAKDLADLGITCIDELLAVTTPAPPAPPPPPAPAVPDIAARQRALQLMQMQPGGLIFNGVNIFQGEVEQQIQQLNARIQARLNQVMQPGALPAGQDGPIPFPFDFPLPGPQRRQPQPRRRRNQRRAVIPPPVPLPPVPAAAPQVAGRRPRGRQAPIPAMLPMPPMPAFQPLPMPPMPVFPPVPVMPPMPVVRAAQAAAARRPRGRRAAPAAAPPPAPAIALPVAPPVAAPRGRGRRAAPAPAVPQFPAAALLPYPFEAPAPLPPAAPLPRPRGHVAAQPVVIDLT